MEFLNKPRAWVVIGVIIAGALLAQQLWQWEVERVEVPPGEFLVRINLWGKDLPEGEILAPDESYKGVMKDVLPEGRHFLNPVFWSYERYKMVDVPPGKCLVLTRKFGKPIPADRLARGEYLAGEDERGIVPEVLLPGKHRINPYAYDHVLCDAVEIRADQVGVRTLKWGKDPSTLKKENPRQSVYVVPEGYRGVQEKPVAPGTYYLNPYVAQIVPVETRTHRVEFKDIWFPSKDGFRLQPHVLVTYKVQAAKAPDLFVMLTDRGKLDQADATEQEQQNNEILQKVLLPLIRGYVRIEGSKFNARDFVAQKAAAPSDGKQAPEAKQQARAVNAREKLQREMMRKIVPDCAKLGIVVESVTLAQNEPTPELTELAGLISDREQMRLVRETNLQLIEQYKTDQETKAKDLLNEQKTEMVAAKTKLDVETKKAEQRKEVEESRLKQELESARIQLEAARNEAQALLTLAKAEAAVINSQNEAEVAGLRTAVQGFPSAQTFAQYHVLTKLAPALSEIFASDNSEFAKLFAAYLTPNNKQPPVVTRMPRAADSKTAQAESGSGGGQ